LKFAVLPAWWRQIPIAWITFINGLTVSTGIVYFTISMHLLWANSMQHMFIEAGVWVFAHPRAKLLVTQTKQEMTPVVRRDCDSHLKLFTSA
jgi:hypothetical protein